jgi:hypothetical protein
MALLTEGGPDSTVPSINMALLAEGDVYGNKIHDYVAHRAATCRQTLDSPSLRISARTSRHASA